MPEVKKDPTPIPATKPVPAPTPSVHPARVCHENDRAEGTGLRRYMIRAVDIDRDVPPTAKYLLAPTRESAVACYFATENLPADSKLSVLELPD